MIKIVSDRDLFAVSAPRGGGKFLWNFLNSSKNIISLEMPYQPSPPTSLPDTAAVSAKPEGALSLHSEGCHTVF